MDLTAYMSMLDWVRPRGWGISSPQSIQVLIVELSLHIEVIIAFLQVSRAIIGVNVIGILPGVIILLVPFPLNLELKPVAEPPCVHILLHHPKLLIIDLDRQWLWLAT